MTPSPTPPPPLLADAMLGGLARWLRVLGLDVAHDPALGDGALTARAVAEDRVLLTRDRKLVERRALRGRHLLVRSEVVDEQVVQVLEELGVEPDPEELFSRCLRCNVPLEPVATEEARCHVPPYVARTHRRFRRCPHCGRLFWRASHVGRMERRLRRLGVLPPAPGEGARGPGGQ